MRFGVVASAPFEAMAVRNLDGGVMPRIRTNQTRHLNMVPRIGRQLRRARCRFLPVIAASHFLSDQGRIGGASRRLEGLPPMLAASIQAPRCRDLSEMHCNNFALVGDAVLTLGDEPLSLG
jgi:hypothetical protein